jgi:exonuclease III
MEECDILFVQEHWYFEHDIKLLQESIDNVQVYGISGMNNNELLVGRPYGGCAIILNNRVKCKFTPFNVNKRCCGGRFDITDNISILFFNVYMPCDILYNHDNNALYTDILYDIQNTCSQYANTDYVIIGGDFNTDLSRVNSLHTRTLNSYVSDAGLSMCLLSDIANVQFTYENESADIMSTLDHFIVSENLLNSLLEYRSLHDGHNLSDHCPIIMKLNINIELITNTTVRCYKNRAQWNLATEDNIDHYKNVFHNLLSEIRLPLSALHCDDYVCKKHGNDIENYCDSIILACLDATDRCIPCTKKKVIAGWKDVAKPIRDEAIFWHRLWIDNGRPKQGIIANIRRNTRAKYKRTVKNLKHNEANIVSQKMAEALQAQNGRNLWKEIKRMNGKRPSIVDIMDNEQGSDNISKLFACNYKDLYNSVSYNVTDMNQIKESVNFKIDNKCCSLSFIYLSVSFNVDILDKYTVVADTISV